jgi:hypothetical protein
MPEHTPPSEAHRRSEYHTSLPADLPLNAKRKTGMKTGPAVEALGLLIAKTVRDQR